jgi:hypothetical protein
MATINSTSRPAYIYDSSTQTWIPIAGSIGPVGPVGPSNVQSVTIPTWTLQTTTPQGSSESSAFGTLLANNSYFFNIIIRGTAASSLTRFRAGLTMRSSDSNSVPNYQYTYAFASTHASGTNNTSESFVISGTITALSNCSLYISISDGEGSNNLVTFANSKAFIQLIGSIS